MPVDQRDQIYRRILDQMIDVRLLEQEAKARAITVPDTDVDPRIGQIKQQFKTEEAFTKELGSRKMTIEELKTDLKKEMTVQKTLEAEILPKVNVTQADLEAFYKENPDQFKQQETIRASHILIPLDSKATDLQKKEARALADGDPEAGEGRRRLRGARQAVLEGLQRAERRRPELLPEGSDGAGVRSGGVRAAAESDQRSGGDAVRLPHHQADRSQARIDRAARSRSARN